MMSGMLRAIRKSAGRGALLALAAWWVSAAEAQQKRVEITGGRDASGQNYVWVVKNLGDSRIVRVEFPHFKADTWTVPEGWKQEATNLHGHTGTTGTSGVCAAWTDESFKQLRRDESARFAMRIGRGLAQAGAGTAIVKLLDGSEVRVMVEVPSPPTLLERYLWVIGFGVILVLFIIMGVRRQRKARAQSADARAASH